MSREQPRCVYRMLGPQHGEYFSDTVLESRERDSDEILFQPIEDDLLIYWQRGVGNLHAGALVIISVLWYVRTRESNLHRPGFHVFRYYVVVALDIEFLRCTGWMYICCKHTY